MAGDWIYSGDDGGRTMVILLVSCFSNGGESLSIAHQPPKHFEWDISKRRYFEMGMPRLICWDYHWRAAVDQVYRSPIIVPDRGETQSGDYARKLLLILTTHPIALSIPSFQSRSGPIPSQSIRPCNWNALNSECAGQATLSMSAGHSPFHWLTPRLLCVNWRGHDTTTVSEFKQTSTVIRQTAKTGERESTKKTFPLIAGNIIWIIISNRRDEANRMMWEQILILASAFCRPCHKHSTTL